MYGKKVFRTMSPWVVRFKINTLFPFNFDWVGKSCLFFLFLFWCSFIAETDFTDTSLGFRSKSLSSKPTVEKKIEKESMNELHKMVYIPIKVSIVFCLKKACHEQIDWTKVKSARWVSFLLYYLLCCCSHTRWVTVATNCYRLKILFVLWSSFFSLI